MDRSTIRGKYLDKFYKEDVIQCLRENFEIEKLKEVLQFDENDKEGILEILHRGLKKEDINTLLVKMRDLDIPEDISPKEATNSKSSPNNDKQPEILAESEPKLESPKENIRVIQISSESEFFGHTFSDNMKQSEFSLESEVKNDSLQSTIVSENPLPQELENETIPDNVKQIEISSESELKSETSPDNTKLIDISSKQQVKSSPRLTTDDPTEIDQQYEKFTSEYKEFREEIPFYVRQQKNKCLLEIQRLGEKKIVFKDILSDCMKKHLAKQKERENKIEFKESSQNYKFKKSTLDFMDRFYRMTEHERELERQKIRKSYIKSFYDI